MQGSSRGFMVLGAAALLLAMLATLVTTPGTAAQDGGSSIEVHNRICPVEYQGTTFFEDCHDNAPDPGLPFTFTHEESGQTWEGTTNAEGNVGFANLPEGTYTISGGAPGDFAEHIVYCSTGTSEATSREQVPVEEVTVGIQFVLPADTDVICDWYEIPFDLSGQQTPVTQPEQFDLPIYVLACQSDPGDMAANDFVMLGELPDGCEQYAGASVTISTPEGSPYGTCVTNANAPCFVTVAIGVDVIASIDPLTLPADYAVVGDTTREYEIVADSEAWILFVAVPAVETPVAPTPAPTLPVPTVTPVEGRDVAIYEGTCEMDPPGAVVAELTDLTGPEPAPDAAVDVVIAESSGSVIDLTLEELMAGDHVLIAWSDGESPQPVACTPIDGQVNASGELVLGIREVEGSGYAGIVYLAPTADGSQTGVSVFLAEGLADDQGPVATPFG